MKEILAGGEARLVEVDVRIDGPREDQEPRRVDELLIGHPLQALCDLGDSLASDADGGAAEIALARQGDKAVHKHHGRTPCR